MANINWEIRAKERSQINKRLNKKIVEVSNSRDAWKKKAMDNKSSLNDLNQKLSILKKKIEQIIEL